MADERHEDVIGDAAQSDRSRQDSSQMPSGREPYKVGDAEPVLHADSVGADHMNQRKDSTIARWSRYERGGDLLKSTTVE